jgi:hypothetical protein
LKEAVWSTAGDSLAQLVCADIYLPSFPRLCSL